MLRALQILRKITELALFLASAKSSFITASIITSDGGWPAY
ncbi:MAG TPA: hypothetical protein VNW95_14995 [Mucilaginibacter sp.]|jgi:hypothetical protein|nr:hypothetical protein [Mucilaginibacter sp.]